MYERWISVLGISILAQSLMFAQSVSSIRGTVSDATGATVPSAKVILVDIASGASRTATSDSSGNFSFTGLSVGKYRLSAQAPGFETFQSTIRLQAGEAAVQTVRLRIGASNEAVTVSAGPNPTSPPLVWNSWLEQYQPSIAFSPVPTLKPDTDYNLVLDLSAIAYGLGSGRYSRDVESDLQKNLRKLTTASLDVLVIPDQVAFVSQPDTERFTTMSIDLKKIAKARGKTFTIRGDPLTILKKRADQKWEFGRISSRLRTSSRVGSASIALLFWSNGKPVDELTLPVCVGDAPCGQADQTLSFSLKGIDSVRIAASDSTSPLPDAAIDLIALSENRLVGVFKCNTCSAPSDREYHTWQIAGTVHALSSYLTRTTLSDFENATKDADYLQHGQELYLTLFRDGSTGQLVPAEALFRRFLMEHSQNQPAKAAPSLFIRLLPDSPVPLFLIPLGLMAVPGTDYYVGRHFRIETPFIEQDYETPDRCIENWQLLLPPDRSDQSSDPLETAKSQFADWIRAFAAWKPHATIVYDLGAFTTWLQADKATPQAAAVLILSHHDSNRIYFSDGGQDIESVDVMRQFANPSLVILTGCGTAKPGASDFLRSFNIDGVGTAVATSYDVDARMAGLFTSRLLTHLAAGSSDSHYALGEARFDATQDVANTINPDTGQPYGPRALVFTLIGNGAVRACVPPLSN